jgi:gentisate 1,2-dioxygenase
MILVTDKNHFDGLDGALEDIRKRQLFPTTYATEHATAAKLHWHSEDVRVYLIEGSVYFLDGNGTRHELEPGDLMTVPARTLHAEGEINAPVVMLIGLEEALPAERFLLVRDPEELES